MISPLSQNLFHRAISQSGTLQNFWADPDFSGEAKQRASELAEYLNCSETEDSKLMLECFREATAEKLTFSQSEIFVIKQIFFLVIMIIKITHFIAE